MEWKVGVKINEIRRAQSESGPLLAAPSTRCPRHASSTFLVFYYSFVFLIYFFLLFFLIFILKMIKFTPFSRCFHKKF